MSRDDGEGSLSDETWAALSTSSIPKGNILKFLSGNFIENSIIQE